MLGPSQAGSRTPPMTPQLALRVALAGGFALLMFAVIFFRLWFLQVLSGSQYAAQAQSNTVLQIPVGAPRGEIVDSSGQPLVQSVAVPSIQIAPRSLPGGGALLDLALKPPVVIPAADGAVFARLAKLLGVSTTAKPCTYTVYVANKGAESFHVPLAPIACQVAQSVAQSQYGNATIKTDVPTYIQDYIAERQAEFPGVLSQDTYVRKYALGNAGAQVFGYLGQITPAELKDKALYKGAVAGDVVGQSGLEAQYNQYLQGVDGAEGVKVNSQGQFEGYGKTVAPTPGDTLKLSLNAKLEQVGQQSLIRSIAANHALGADAGSFVAMDPQNGQIYAIGSVPSYNPASVVNGISTKEWAHLNNPSNHYPLLDRAIQSAGPDGSTFKVVTATAALQSGRWPLNGTFNDYPGRVFCVSGLCLHNAGGANYGVVDLQQAIEVSDDEFFYNLGVKLNGNPAVYPKGFPLQAWARRYGLGQLTGIDLPGEIPGEIGSPLLQTQLWKQERQCDTGTGLYKGHPPHPAVLSPLGDSIVSGGCGIANTSYWTVGDNLETGVGQYQDQLTPIQLAVVYAAVENGGTIVTPHVGAQILSPSGSVIQAIAPPPKRKLNINPTYLAAIQQGLYLAAKGPRGTSTDVMSSFPEPVHGKTGSAELGTQGSAGTDGWYACYVPASATSKPIVVVVEVQKGGYGTSSAAPVARQILSQWFFGKPGPMVGLG